LTIAEQNAGRSDGERLEIKLPATTTSSSMKWAPVAKVGANARWPVREVVTAHFEVKSAFFG